MKPNFALSLSFQGIRLLHRSGTGWTIVGDVSLDSADLAGELAMLRKTALSLDPAGLRTKILLPNDQIKYLALDTTRASEDDVRHALDGVTPYAVTDLLYDFVKGMGRTYIAAVARETLDEAEAFAVEHRFAPVSFAGVPDEFTFLGESFFGQTKASATLLPAGEKVERDATPVRVQSKSARTPLPPVLERAAATAASVAEAPLTAAAPAVTAPPAAISPTVDESPASELRGVPAAPDVTTVVTSIAAPIVEDRPLVLAHADGSVEASVTPEPEAIPASETPTASPEASAAAVSAETPAAPESKPEIAATTIGAVLVAELAAEPANATAQTEAADTPAPVFASRARPQRAQTEDMPTAAPVAKPATTLAAPARTATGDSKGEPVFSRRAPVPPAARSPVPPAPTPTKATPQPGVPPVPTDAAGSSPPMPAQSTRRQADAAIAKESTPRVTIDAVGTTGRGMTATAPAPLAAPTITGLSVVAKPETTVAAVMAPQRTPKPAGTAQVVPFVPNRAAPADKPAAPEPTKGMIGLGKRAAPETLASPTAAELAKPARAKPKFLGLILTVILLVVLAAVAAWASITDNVLSRWFSGEAESVQTATADAAAIVPVIIGDARPAELPPGETASGLTASQDSAILRETVPAVTETSAADTPITTPEEATPGEELAPSAETVAQAVPDAPAPDAAATAAAAAAVATAIAGLAEDQPAAIAPETEVTADAMPTPVAPAEVTGTPVTPEEADRFYAATGVWIRAPRLPLTPETEELAGIETAAVDAALDNSGVTSLPAMGPDGRLVVQLNPPPPGTRFARDDRGFILATAEGTLTPDGMMIFARAPALVPPTRPGTVAPVAVVAPETAVLAETPETAAVPPIVPNKRPQARPDTLAPVSTETEATPVDPTTLTAEGTLPDGTLPPTEPVAEAILPGGVSLDGLRPRERADSILPEEAAVVTVAFDGPAPPSRPEGLAPEGATSSPAEAVVAEETPADPSQDMNAALASIVENARDPLLTATAQAVAVVRRPDARPNNFARVVEQQTARLARQQPATEVASAEQAAPAVAANPNLSTEEQAETAPDVVSSAAAVPSGSVPGGVAQAATFENVIALREINLIGVYGTPNDRRALVRTGNGRYLRVEVGDSLDGGQVSAIGEDSLNYVKRGRTITLEIPQ
ncbi:MAG: hypothetical protein NTX73_11000 [Rhodobacterales bacterium]|nr:hypothetical protein [Rhodobacterales bacterium]